MISVTWLAMWIKWGPAEHRTISQGKPMNELLGSTRRAQASVQSGQELGTENSQSNEFMTVFSHELGNSLGAIRMAAQILTHGDVRGPRHGEGKGPHRTSGRADDASGRRPSRRVTHPRRSAAPAVRANRSARRHGSRRADRRIDHATAQSLDDHVIPRCAGVAAGRPLRHRAARTRASVSDSPWCAVWSSAMAAASPWQALVPGKEASSLFAYQRLRSSFGCVRIFGC